MGRAQRWMALFAGGACVAGAVVALMVSAPRVTPASGAAITTIPSSAAQELRNAETTRAVVAAANGLTASIAKARETTTGVLASSYARLSASRAAVAAEQAQLVAEQRSITAEAQQLTARAAALEKEGLTLQREAVALRAARAASTASSVVGTQSSHGGEQNDN